MKKITSLLAVMAMAVLSLTMTSCDEDVYVADTLEGVWRGNMHVYSEWNGQVYTAYETEIAFDSNPYEYSSGTGYWIDYYSGAPWDYFASHIEWTVDDGVISIYSIEDNSYFYIYDYSLSGGRFRGWMDSDYNDPMQFNLYKTSSSGWDDYEWGWDYWYDSYYNDYPYPYSRSGAAEAAKPVRKIGVAPDTIE